MKTDIRWVGLVGLLMLMVGCTGMPSRKSGPPAVDRSSAAQAQVARAAWLQSHPIWSMSGRVAIRNGGKGGSARIDWAQKDATFDVSLSAPITRQRWRLTGDGANVVLEGLDGGPKRGADATELLREATGWEIPVQALVYWVRGQAAPDLSAAELQYAQDGSLSVLSQAGWRIAYTAWQPGAGPTPAMPVRIEAERGEARVRLIVDDWQSDGATK